MNNTEAITVLERHLESYRKRTHSDLASLVNANPDTAEIIGPTGVKYQIKITGLWDDEPNGVIRVLGSIDDGGIRSYVPLCSDFLMAPNGTFVDE